MRQEFYEEYIQNNLNKQPAYKVFVKKYQDGLEKHYRDRMKEIKENH